MRRVTPICTLMVLLVAFVAPVQAAEADAAPAEPFQGSLHFSNVQETLAELGFYRGEMDGENNRALTAAVLAFHKATGAERTTVWSRLDWARAGLLEPVGFDDGHVDHVNVDLTNQVAYAMRGDELIAVLGISSGSGGTYPSSSGGTAVARTPRGEFTFDRHIDGYRYARLGTLYKPWYFKGGFAIHGSSSVPSYPASHGCVRVTNWDADWLTTALELGVSISIFDGELIDDVLLSVAHGALPTLLSARTGPSMD